MTFTRQLAIVISYTVKYETTEDFEAAKQACRSFPLVAQGSGYSAIRNNVSGLEGPLHLDRICFEDMPLGIEEGSTVVHKHLGVEMVFKERYENKFVCEYLDRMGAIRRYEGYSTDFGVKPKLP